MVAPPPRSFFMLYKHALAPMLAGGTAPGSLWARLPVVTLVELRSDEMPYEEGQFDRLLGYAHLCRANAMLRPFCPPSGSEVGAVLVMPERTPALLVDVLGLGLRWKQTGTGCWQLHGGLFPIHVIEVNRVAAEEDDELLLFLVDQARGVDPLDVN